MHNSGIRRGLATISSLPSEKPGLIRKVPGLFVCADRTNAPLAESADARVSQAWCSGFESRVGYQICGSKVLPPLRQCVREKRNVLLQPGCGKGSRVPNAREPVCSRRLTVRIAGLQLVDAGSIPAGNTSIWRWPGFPGSTRAGHTPAASPRISL